MKKWIVCMPRHLFGEKKLSSAFTLIEMLIVVSLLSLLALASYNALSNGLRIWQKSRQLVVEEDILLFFEKITVDLRNALAYSLIPIEGSAHRFSFPSIVGNESSSGLGMVEYYYDLNQGAIFRRWANYGQALDKTFGTARLLVPGIEACVFEYWFITELGEKSLEAISQTMPSGIKITVEFLDKGKRKVLRKLIDIPTGA